MFGKNEIVGQKYFKEAKDNELFVTSMFMTLQGEGIFAGRPAFFIRLAKCNLACSFCDTFFDDGDWMTFDQIEDGIESAISQFYEYKGIARPNWTHHDTQTGSVKRMVLVVTGGEPTLQANLGPFLDKMNNIFDNTQIESNGIVFQQTLPHDTVKVISPKVLEKNGKELKYIQPKSDVLESADCLKFVMSADPDSTYSSIPGWAQEWAQDTGRPVFISPMNIYNDVPAKSKELRNDGKNRVELVERSRVDEVVEFWEDGLLNMKENEKNHKYAAQYCMEHGYCLNLQIHLYAGLA